MASGSDEDPDLESLRSALLASLKTKTIGTTSQGQSDENVTKSEGEEKENEEEKQNELVEDEEELHALRLAALKSKRDDSLPKAAPTTFEQKGNLISIQIIDPEEERRKAEEEMKAKANAAIDPELGKAAKSARFRNFDSSDSENDEEEEADGRESEQSEDEKSIDSSSSSSSSKSEGSVSSKSSGSSSSESAKDSKSSSSSESESESEVEGERNKKEKQENSSEPNASRKQDGHREVKDQVQSEKGSKGRHQSSEGRNKDEKSTKGTRSVKDRLGARLPEEKSRRASDKNSRSSGQVSRTIERGRDGHDRDNRRQRSDMKEERRQNDRLKVNSHPSSNDRHSQRTTEGRNDRHRTKGHLGDLRDRLHHEKERKDSQDKESRTRSVEHSSSRRDETHESSKRIPNEITSRTRDRPRNDRRRDTARNSRTDTRQADTEKNSKYTDRKTFGKDPSLKNISISKNKSSSDVSQKSNVQNSKKASDSESLSDIPLESEEEKDDSDSENVRFRKGRHELKSEKTEHEVESNSQSRIVMSLQLLTESELKEADDKISKDFKRRRNVDGHGIDTLNRGSGRINLRTLDRRPRNSDRRGQGSPDRTNRPRAREAFGRRKPRPSDFVSESESEEEDKSGAALRSQVSGAGDAGKRDRNFPKSESVEENVRKDDKNRNSNTERDERRRRERRERREKRSKRRVVEEKSGSHSTDEENGEEAVKQLSIRDRLGERPIGSLRSSIKSRLGPKVSPSSPTNETEGSEVIDGPKAKVRKIEVSYRDSDENFESHLDDLGSIEGAVEQQEKLVTKPDDLRHKMKRKLHKREKDHRPEEVVRVKRKVMKNNVWAEVLQERSSKEGRGGSSSPHRGGSREREGNEKRRETTKEGKKKEDEILEAKIKRIKEMNAAILEKQKQIQKEKELFGS